MATKMKDWSWEALIPEEREFRFRYLERQNRNLRSELRSFGFICRERHAEAAAKESANRRAVAEGRGKREAELEKMARERGFANPEAMLEAGIQDTLSKLR